MSGTGPSGRIIKKDILNHTGLHERVTDSPPAVPDDLPVSSSATNLHTKGLLESKSVKISGMRSIIAKRLTESKQTIPHFYLSKEIDAVPLINDISKLLSLAIFLARGEISTRLSPLSLLFSCILASAASGSSCNSG